MIAQKKKYGRNLLALRPREISLEDASGLWVKSEDLFDWAIRSAEDYFEVTEAIKNKVKKLAFFIFIMIYFECKSSILVLTLIE